MTPCPMVFGGVKHPRRRHRRRSLFVGAACALTSLFGLNPVGIQKAEAQAAVVCTGNGFTINAGYYNVFSYWNGGCNEVVSVINLTSYWYAYYADWYLLAANPNIG